MVEVRQRTLSPRVAVEHVDEEDKEDDEEDDEEEEAEAGGGRQEEAGRRRQEEDQATDIKSNNPHLAGGEKHSP